MFERLTSTVLQQALKEYFVLDDAHDANVMDVWSGFVRWNQMELRTAWLNEKIQAKGLPFEVLRGHVNLLTISIPWSKLNLLSTRNNKKNNNKKKKDAGDAGTIVVVLDGVQLLVRSKYEFDDDALDQARVKSRRRKLQQAAETKQTNNNAGGWRESLRQRLKDGILSQMLDNLHLHIRDLHIRFEDIQSSPHLPMAFGLVLESIHLQHVENNNDREAVEPTWVQKQSQVNQFAIYANALEETELSLTKNNGGGNNNTYRWSERSILQHCTQRDVVVEVLDRSIPRRANSLQATTRLAPQHTYILHPVDVTAQVESGTDPSLRVAQNRPVLSVEVNVPTVHMALQDVHVHAGLAWWANFQDHKYRARYRPFRPRVSVTENPRAWWQYAATAIQSELQQSRLHWSWRRFHKRYSIRKRYCDLYEQRMRVELDAVDAVSLSEAEETELHAIEDGNAGDLAVEDILLYRAIVHMRLGETTPRSKRSTRKQSSILMTTSWLQKTLLGMVKDDSAATDEFQRAIDLWEEAKQNIGPPLEESASWVAISVGFTVEKGIISAYTPLRSTMDQTAAKRLQMLFLSFVFEKSRLQGRLLGDFESLRLDTVLQDFYAEEERSDRSRHTVIARELTATNNILPDVMHSQFLKLHFLKNSKRTTDDFHIGINAEVQKLVIALQPGCEWIQSGRSLVRPLPRFTKIKEFWGDVGMNFINTMKSQGREIFAKAETAVADHKSIDVDIWIDCPIVQMHGEEESHLLEIDFGQTRIRTERLAGVAKSKLLGTLKDEAKLLSALDESGGRGDNGIEFHQANSGGVNESMRSAQLNDLIDGIQVFRDDMTALDDLAQTSGGIMSGGIESFFYDTYVIDMKTGMVRVQNEHDTSDILQQIDIRATIQKSIIPRDATLFRYKMLYSVGEIQLVVSDDDVFLLRDMLDSWRSVIDASYKDGRGSLDLSVHYGSVGLFLQQPTLDDAAIQALPPTTEHHSDFDEDEFFDTMEHEAAFSEMESAITGDNFMAESDSVLDSDSHSLARSVRSRSRRKRQSSISDVSSISDGSVAKRRGGANDPYLNAENLARLEETADEDMADDFYDDTGEIDDESFQSAVSASQVLALIQSLEEDIGDTKSSLSRVQEKLSEFRAPESAALHGDQAQRLRLKNALQLEVERIRAELMAMTATRDDLKARVGALSSSAVSVSRGTNRSVERASILLQTRKKRGSVGVEHSLAGFWSRSILQLSGTIESATVRFIFGPGVDRNKRSCFWTRLANASLVFIVSTNDNKIFLSNESLSSGVNESGIEKSQHVFVGGPIDDYNTDLLSSRFPHLIPPPSVDEKLFRVAITIFKAKPGADQSRLFRVRVAIGDFQLTPRPYYVKAVRSFTSQLKGKRESRLLNDSRLDEGRTKTSQPNQFYYDSLVTLSSCKIVDGDGAAVATVVGDVTLRISGATTPQVYKDRSQIDLKWGGLQLLYFGEPGVSQPVEIFCKRDAYAPMMRVRIRAQKVLPGDEAGWVIGKSRIPNGGVLTAPNVEFIRHIHVSIQVEALTLTISPEILTALLACKDSWSIQSAHRNDPKPPNKMLRMRLDAMVRKVSVLGAGSVDDLLSEDAAGQKVLLHAGLNAALQIDPGKNLVARTKLNGISLTFPDDQIPFLNPFSITILADRQSDGQTKSHQATPIIEAPDNFVWICDQAQPEYPRFSDKTDISCDLLITCLGSQCDLNVNPKTASFVTALSSRLVEYFKKETGAKANNSLGKKSLALHMRMTFDRIQVSCFEQKHAKLSRSSAPQFRLGADKVMVVFRKRKLDKSVWASVEEIESIDFPHRRGIQSLGRSTLHGTRTIAVDEQRPMFEVEATFNRADEKIVADLSVCFGRFQILVLPSLLRSILTFKREFLLAFGAAHGNETRKSPDEVKRTDLILEGPARVQIAMKFVALEILLPTRDVSRSIREGAGDVGVVSVRCGLEYRNSFSANDFGRLMDIENMENVSVHDVKTAIEDFVARRMEQSQTGNVVNMSTELLVTDFQILRTAMRVPSSDPIVFDTARSSSREQRVTNSFSVAFRYELVFTVFERSLHHGGTTKKITVSQAAEVKAEFVDILLYIARSDRGINTAIEATVRPVLALLKGGKNTQVENAQPDRLSSLMQILATSTSVAAFRIEGVQVTCVPGGATRLTESPIIKFTLFRIAAGCGIVGQAAPPDVRLTSSTNLNGINTASPKEYRHVIAGAWLSCEISAYYHNRRLVEWEPFIEPWSFVVRLGADLMRILRLQAVSIEFDIFPETDTKSAEPALPSPANRLAHLSRLLRSPFGTGQSYTGVLTKTEQSISDTDVCRVLLRLHALEILHSAVFRAPGVPNVDRLPPLPGENCLEWMQGHGYPVRSEASNTQPVVAPALLFHVSDEGSLDINFTGAMIDTLWQYLSSGREKETAPHLIQNRSGLVSNLTRMYEECRTQAFLIFIRSPLDTPL
eukprot:scaffold1650_cov163-Amphora_coffeaeformis.AAC.3